MAFGDFKKVSEVQEKFRIKYTASALFEVEAASPPEQFLTVSSAMVNDGNLGNLLPTVSPKTERPSA